MARVVMITDSETGNLVDAAGAKREAGRYSKFAKRILSSDPVPRLDYGWNGGRKMEVVCNGQNGDKVTVRADVTELTGSASVAGDAAVSGDLSVGGKPLEAHIYEGAIATIDGYITSNVNKGIKVEFVPEGTMQDGITGPRLLIRLSDWALAALQLFLERPDSHLVSKSQLRNLVQGISTSDTDSPETVRANLNTLITRIGELANQPD